MGKLNLKGYGQAGIAFPEINVNMKIRNGITGELIKEINKHNRVCRIPLYNILRAINGEFSECDDQTVAINKRYQLYNFIPRFLAFGYGDESNKEINSNSEKSETKNKEVDVNDTKLENELTYIDEDTKEILKYPRMKITRPKQFENQYSSPYIKIIIKHFVPMEDFKNEWISEAGLFCEETGDNLWARITFDKFKKDDTMVIDLTWSITIVIIETEQERFSMVDKLKLKKAIKDCLIFFGTNPNYAKIATALQKANDAFANKDILQVKIDEITSELTECINELDNI